MRLDPTTRFTDRATAYAAGRPGYPPGLVAAVAEALHLAPGFAVADLGSGTGLSAEPFLAAGCPVVAVEPNAAMRAQAERRLAAWPAFRSQPGTAEATGLPDASVDLVVAAQAFHWFDPGAARRECLRILRRPACAALIWNDRRETGTPFAEGYDRLLRAYAPDYAEIQRRHHDEAELHAFFGDAGWRELLLPNPVPMDRATLLARVASASYMPAAGSPAEAPMRDALEALFSGTSVDGVVVMEHDTRICYGLLAG